VLVCGVGAVAGGFSGVFADAASNVYCVTINKDQQGCSLSLKRRSFTAAEQIGKLHHRSPRCLRLSSP
jgi:predicted rRNA methylase YqxC with S4 and FtsJ domains